MGQTQKTSAKEASCLTVSEYFSRLPSKNFLNLFTLNILTFTRSEDVLRSLLSIQINVKFLR